MNSDLTRTDPALTRKLRVCPIVGRVFAFMETRAVLWCHNVCFWTFMQTLRFPTSMPQFWEGSWEQYLWFNNFEFRATIYESQSWLRPWNCLFMDLAKPKRFAIIWDCGTVTYLFKQPLFLVTPPTDLCQWWTRFAIFLASLQVEVQLAWTLWARARIAVPVGDCATIPLYFLHFGIDPKLSPSRLFEILGWTRNFLFPSQFWDEPKILISSTIIQEFQDGPTFVFTIWDEPTNYLAWDGTSP